MAASELPPATATELYARIEEEVEANPELYKSRKQVYDVMLAQGQKFCQLTSFSDAADYIHTTHCITPKRGQPDEAGKKRYRSALQHEQDVKRDAATETHAKKPDSPAAGPVAAVADENATQFVRTAVDEAAADKVAADNQLAADKAAAEKLKQQQRESEEEEQQRQKKETEERQRQEEQERQRLEAQRKKDETKTQQQLLLQQLATSRAATEKLTAEIAELQRQEATQLTGDKVATDKKLAADKPGAVNGGDTALDSGAAQADLYPDKFLVQYESNLERLCRKVSKICAIHRIYNDRVQVALWSNFPEDGVQSIATLVREQGAMTQEAAEVLLQVAAKWAGLTISLQWAKDQPFVTGDGLVVQAALCLRSVSKFDIRIQTTLVSSPQENPLDPVCSSALLRAISGAASLLRIAFPSTVLPEQDKEVALVLPAAAKPLALTIAQNIWSAVKSALPQVKLGDHTDKDAMGSTNLGSMFKVTSLLVAQGILCKYILCAI